MSPRAPQSAPPPKPAPRKPRRKPPASTPAAAPADDVLLPSGVGDDFIPGTMLVKYAAFVAAYLETGDAVEAVKTAGFPFANTQAQKAIASQLLRNPYVRQRIAEQYQAILAKTGATVERVWQEIARTAFADPGAAYGEDGEPLPMHAIPEETRRAITGYKVVEKTFGDDTSVEKQVTFGGKDAALDKLMKLHRMVDTDKLVVLNGDDFLKAMEAGRERVRAGTGR